MSDEAVRKEFEAVAEDILDSAYDSLISHGQRKAEIIAKLQASRSAAIQECATKARHEAWHSAEDCSKIGEHIEKCLLALKEG